MLPKTCLRNITSCVLNVSRNDAKFVNEFLNIFRKFSTTRIIQQKKGKKSSQEDDTCKIIKPGNCAELPDPILGPLCKVAVIIGGANGFGFAAADHLLCKGARGVVIADSESVDGEIAAKKLCETYGKGRAIFLACDIRNTCEFESVLQQALNKHKQIHVLFNDLDKRRYPIHPAHCSADSGASNNNYTRKTIHAGMKLMSKESGGHGGIIVNCASVLGFMGWPEDPAPVYCMNDPAIETTIDLTTEYPSEKTGVRLVALCPTNRSFSAIGLPSFPDPVPNDRFAQRPPCIPSSKWRIGSALNHAMAWAKSGSAWVVEPSPCPNELPRQVHFPEKEGEKVDPKVYDSQPCPVALKAHCAAIRQDKCPDISKHCQQPAPKKK